MTDPAQPRPIPGPPRPVPGPVGSAPRDAEREPKASPEPVVPAGSRFAGLAERPVAEHVAVYEAEHERLQRELSTIDQL